MPITVYSDYQALESSEKIVLVNLEASIRLIGWIYWIPNYQILGIDYISAISSVKEDGIELTEVSSYMGMPQGSYYFSSVNNSFYIRTTDDGDPNLKFIAVTFQNFYSNVGGIHEAHDLSTGHKVHWLPYIKSTSQFGVALDNKEFLGFALEGSGSIQFLNSRDYWDSIYDKWYWDNQKISVYSWHRDLPITEAKLIFKGFTQSRTWTEKLITFTIRDTFKQLRQPLDLSIISDYGGAVVLPNLSNQLQRIIYGRIQGHIPTNISATLPTGNEITGTAITVSSTTIIGSGTIFLTEVSPEDELIFGDDERKYTVSTVDSDNTLNLTELYEGSTGSGKSIKIIPSHPKRYQNRTHLIAGHSLREPSTTITYSNRVNTFTVADDTDFFVGAEIAVGSQITYVTSVNNNIIRVLPSLGSIPIAGTSVTLSSVWNVYLNNRKLTKTRDYTFSATNGTITLEDNAEFNVAPVLDAVGTVTFTNASRDVSGSGTIFKTEFKPGDWIKSTQESDWFEILSITNDTNLKLRSACIYNRATAAHKKSPDIYEQGKVTLSLSSMGATENGTTSGIFINTGPLAAKDILIRSGMTNDIVSSTFDDSSEIASQIIGMAIPSNVDDTKTESIRDIIALINQSIFGSLYQNSDFKLEYSVIDPSKPDDFVKFIEAEVLKLSIKNDSTRIVKDVVIQYANKEYDADSLDSGFSLKKVSSEIAEYLAKTNDEFRTNTILQIEQDALVYAQRWVFLREVSSSIVSIDTALKGALININDRIKLEHEKLYERIASISKIKLAAVSAIKRNHLKSGLEIDDIGSAFSRCSSITENTANIFSDASENEKILNGYITSNYGYIISADDFGINLIW